MKDMMQNNAKAGETASPTKAVKCPTCGTKFNPGETSENQNKDGRNLDSTYTVKPKNRNVLDMMTDKYAPAQAPKPR